METAAAAARSGPGSKTLSLIENLVSKHATAVAMRDATATQVVARYAAGRADAFRAGDTTLPEDRPVPLPRATRLIIDGTGELEVPR